MSIHAEPNKPTSFDVMLHNISLQLANTIRIIAEVGEGYFPKDCKNDLIEAYTNIRRHIGINPETGKRFGASYAHGVMQRSDIDGIDL